MPASRAVLSDIIKYGLRADKPTSLIRADGSLRPLIVDKKEEQLVKNALHKIEEQTPHVPPPVVEESHVLEPEPEVIEEQVIEEPESEVIEEQVVEEALKPRRRGRKKATSTEGN